MGRTRIAAVLLAASLVVVACGDDDDGSSPATVPADAAGSTPTSERETTTTTEDPTAAVEQAFYDQWDAFVEITSDPNIDNPLIDQFFTGEAKDSLLDVVSEFIAENQAARLPDDPDNFQPRAVEVKVLSPSKASVVECTTDGAVIFDVSSGGVVDDSVDTYEARNEFVRIDGRWKLSASHPLPDGDPACDAR